MPTKAEDIVTFLLPDGTEVSNDPRWAQQKMAEQILAQHENLGVATGPDADLKHSMVSPPQSGQPDVGPAAVGVGPDRSAAAANLQPGPEGVVDPRLARSAAHTSRQGQEGFGMGDEEDEDASLELEEADKPYSEWSPAELKAEVKARRKLGREVAVEGRSTKANVIKALEKDDEDSANQPPQ